MASCERYSALKQKTLLLLCLFCIMILTNGVNAPCFTFFLVNFIDELDSTSALVGLSHSISLGIVAVFGPSVFRMVKLFGYKKTLLVGCLLSSVGLVASSQATQLYHIFLSHSLATGVGLCVIELTFTYIIAENFDESASLYIGFMHAGSAMGFIITPLACSYLRLLYGWRGTLLLLGAIGLNSLIMSLIFFNTLPKLLHRRRIKRLSTEDDKVRSLEPDNTGTYPSEVSGEIDEMLNTSVEEEQPIEHVSSLRLFCKYPKLIMMSIEICVCYFAYLGFFVHFSAGVISKGRSDEDAARLFAMFGCGSLIGRLGSFVPVRLGLITEHNLYILSLMLTGVGMLLFTCLDSLTIMIIVTLFLGISLGGMLVLFPVVTRDFVPRDRFKEAFGLLMIPGGVSCIVGGYIMGAIYDVTDSYNGSFFLASGCMFAMGLLMFCPKLLNLCSHRTSDKKPRPAAI